MLLWPIISSILIAALLATWLCLRPRRPAAAPDTALIALWRDRAAEMRQKLAQSPNDPWAWLWRIRLRVVTFMLGRAGDHAEPDTATHPDDAPPLGTPIVAPTAGTAADQTLATYTRDRERARMDWTPPWSRRGDSLTSVLSRVSENSADGPAVIDEQLDRFERRWRRCGHFCAVYVASFFVVGLLIGEFAYFWAIVEVYKWSLELPSSAATAVSIGVPTCAINMMLIWDAIDRRNRSTGWLLLTVLGIFGVITAHLLRRHELIAAAWRHSPRDEKQPA